MSIKIYNTLTRTPEEFLPIKPGEVTMYVCGITVYDECHLGHARSAFVFDLIRRYLKYRGYRVKFVKNITDVDDKIINKARSQIADAGSPPDGMGLNQAVKEVAARYTESFHSEMAALGIESPDIEPKATEHIQDMIDAIVVLIKRGDAYVSGGDVYFDVRRFKRYGNLSNQNLSRMLEGTRIEADEKKRDPLDFALWKAAKENEPTWNSPWGAGRPGWHIECSVMSTKYLGPNFDIHGGGRDLIFPHHENEIAQAECATGKRFANYWIHNGLLTINGEKMSKSLGNYVSIKDVLARCGNPDILKLFFLGTHYSHPIDFSWERMDEAKKAYERFRVLFDKIDNEAGSIAAASNKTAAQETAILDLRRKFEDAMDDDFNTPVALATLFEMVNFSNKVLAERPKGFQLTLKRVSDSIKELGGVIGISFVKFSVSGDDVEIKELVERRRQLRKDGKFKEADKIRDELKRRGIVVEDGKDLTRLRRSCL